MAQRSLKVATALALAMTATGVAGGGVHAEPLDAIGSFLGLEERTPAAQRRRDVATTGAIARAPSESRSDDPLQPPGPSIPPKPSVDAARVAPPAAPKAAAEADYPVDLLISLANDAVFTKDPYPKGQRSDPRMIKLQVLLDRNNASPGVIDGIFGDNVVKAVKAFEEMNGHDVDGVVDAKVWNLLEGADAEPALVSYTITPEDVAGPFVPTMPGDYAEQALLPSLAYRDVAELLAERFHMDEAFLRRINPDVSFTEAGVDVVVANVGKPLKLRVAHVIADKGRKQLRGYDAEGRLVVAYPATIGSSDLPSPTGMHAVKAIAINPDYWYRPKVNFVQGTNTKALRLPAGPNAPVGATWVGLDKPTYGLHGTPEPSKIDKTNSHGCVRLTNWDARELAGLVVPGVPVDFQEPPVAETLPMAEAEMVAPIPAPDAASPMAEQWDGDQDTPADVAPRPAPVRRSAERRPAEPRAEERRTLEPLPAARTIPYLRERQAER